MKKSRRVKENCLMASENVPELTKIFVNTDQGSAELVVRFRNQLPSRTPDEDRVSVIMNSTDGPELRPVFFDTLSIVLILIYFFMVSLCCTLWVSTLELNQVLFYVLFEAICFTMSLGGLVPMEKL